MSFIEELKRRNVFRVGAAYAVAGWLLMQIVDVFAPALHLPDWFPTAIAFLLLIGFPISLFFAWAFEITPDGIKRESEVPQDASLTHETAAKLDRVTITLLVLVAGFVVVERFVLTGDDDQAPTPAIAQEQPGNAAPTAVEQAADDGKISIAVLPFVNMSDDAQNEYFSDGISEELLNVLVKIDSLRVPSRTSSFTFKGSTQTLVEIGKALKVDHVLEGSVRKAGDRIRVTAQLIEVNTDTHMWSETYTRELDDIFAVQDEISQSIVQALQVTLSGSDQQQLAIRSTNNVEAYNQYLLGRHIWNRRTGKALLESVAPLQEAVALDPHFEKAWTALADAYVLMPEYGAGTIEEYIPKATQAIGQALAINPDSARALTARGYLKSMYQYDIEGALQDFQRAIELEPGYATAHQWYGEILAVSRRLDEGLAQIDLAIELDPLAPVIRHVKGWLLEGAKRFEEAEEAYQGVFTVDPGYLHTHFNLSSLYAMMGKFDLARQESNFIAGVYGFDNAPSLAKIDAMEHPDDPALKQKAIDLMVQAGPFYPDGASGRAQAFMVLGAQELALQNLEEAFEAGDPYAIHMNRFDQYFGPIRDNPRFQALLRKMNLLPRVD